MQLTPPKGPAGMGRPLGSTGDRPGVPLVPPSHHRPTGRARGLRPAHGRTEPSLGKLLGAALAGARTAPAPDAGRLRAVASLVQEPAP